MASRGREATREAILAAVAAALTSQEAVSMAEVAARAGIARGTLYRYFPTRRALLEALEAAARQEASRRLADARLDQVGVDEGLARAVRALVSLGANFLFLVGKRRLGPNESGFITPIVALLERGREQGEIREDVPLACLVESLLALIGACIRSGKPAGMGSEDVSATAIGLFLGGAHRGPP